MIETNFARCFSLISMLTAWRWLGRSTKGFGVNIYRSLAVCLPRSSKATTSQTL